MYNAGNQSVAYQFTPASINGDTAMGMSKIW